MPRDNWGDRLIAYKEALSAYPQDLLIRPAHSFEDLFWLFTGRVCEGHFVPNEGRKSRGAIRMNYEEGELLFTAVRMSHGDILEIGRRFGGSTVLLQVAAAGRQVISVDAAPAHIEVCAAYLERCEPKPVLLIQDSRIELQHSFGFVLIDGDHSFDVVAEDTRTHWLSCKSGGFLAYHDAVPGAFGTWEGVTRVTRALLEGGYAEESALKDSLLVLRKIAELPSDFLSNETMGS